MKPVELAQELLNTSKSNAKYPSGISQEDVDNIVYTIGSINNLDCYQMLLNGEALSSYKMDELFACFLAPARITLEGNHTDEYTQDLRVKWDMADLPGRILNPAEFSAAQSRILQAIAGNKVRPSWKQVSELRETVTLALMWQDYAAGDIVAASEGLNATRLKPEIPIQLATAAMPDGARILDRKTFESRVITNVVSACFERGMNTNGQGNSRS